MTTDPSAGDLPADASKEQIEADIKATRDRLAASVEELAAKADVKAQVGAAARQTRDDAQAKAHQAQRKVAAGTNQLIQTYRRLPTAARLGLIVGPIALLVLLIVRNARR